MITDASWSYEIVVNDQTYQNYIVGAVKLEAGKTLKDLQDYSQSTSINLAPPSWATLYLLDFVEPLSRTFHGVTLTGDPLYFSCLVQGPGDQRVIDNFGPVNIIQ